MLFKLYRLLLWTQGTYTLITALWGLLHIESFMWVTGPKTDIWLVKTVSAVLVAVAACLFSFLRFPAHPLPAVLIGSLTAFGLGFIDIYYSVTGTIKWVYLLDAAVEGLFLITWLILFFNLETLHKGNMKAASKLT